MSKTLPKKLPVLTAKDICRGDYTDESGLRHCLLGWAQEVHGDHTSWPSTLPIARAFHVPDAESVTSFNDDTRYSRSKIAAVWNHAARALGYVESGKWWVRPQKGAAHEH